MSGDTPPQVTFTRTWTQRGSSFTADKQAQLASVFATLAWQPFPCTLSFSEGYVVKAFLEQMTVQQILEVAVSSRLAPYGLLGLHCQYANGRAKVYILDRGDDAIFLATDFWPHTERRESP